MNNEGSHIIIMINYLSIIKLKCALVWLDYFSLRNNYVLFKRLGVSLRIMIMNEIEINFRLVIKFGSFFSRRHVEIDGLRCLIANCTILRDRFDNPWHCCFYTGFVRCLLKIKYQTHVILAYVAAFLPEKNKSNGRTTWYKLHERKPGHKS